MNTQQHYVLGFAMTEDKQNILLIKKDRPVWQAGLYNGIGGKIENHELFPIHAMIREFKEEADLDTSSEQWRLFTTMEGPSFKIFCYYGYFNHLHNYNSLTTEQVELIPISDLFKNEFKNCISNLKWLIGMVTDSDIDRINGQIIYLNQ